MRWIDYFVDLESNAIDENKNMLSNLCNII